MKKKINFYNLLYILFLTFCIQFTDLKIGLVKVSEILLLLLLPILFKDKSNKYISYMILFFSISLISSLFITYFLSFEYLGNSVLKSPYIISILRYLEILTCLVLCTITYSFFKSKKKAGEFNIVFRKFINTNLLITLVFVIIYLLVIFGIIDIDETRVVYSNYRLRGFFVEGGPYGLMLSFIFICTFLEQPSKWRKYKRLFLLIVILLLAKSKAGFLCTILWIGIENYQFLKRKFKELMYPLIVLALIVFYFLFINIGSMYVNEINIIKTSIKERPQDPNIIMGRISATFIVPKLIKDHPFLGIGIGNYPLLRNNKEYRGFLTLPIKENRIKDAHGFGGIIDILLYTGIIGLSCFVFILYLIKKSLTNTSKEKFLIFGFVLLFLFGVQIYFLYPWALLGLILVKKNSYNEISC